jgi:hypothetical protein
MRPLCADATEDQAAFFVYRDQFGLPASTYSCFELASQAAEQKHLHQQIASLQIGLADSQEKLAAASDDIGKVQQLLLADVRMNLNQQALIDKSVKLSATASGGVKDLAAKLEQVSATVKAESESTAAFLQTLQKHLEQMDVQLKKL